MKGKLQRYGKAVVLAGGLAAASGAAFTTDGGFSSQKDHSATVANNSDKTPAETPTAKSAPSTSASVKTVASVSATPKKVVAPTIADTPVKDLQPTVTPAPRVESVAQTSFAKVITESKNPLVQDIVNKGGFKLSANSTVTDSMIDPFMSLANADQKKELHKLRNFINLGLGVYFNEHFGSPAKVAESMRDPKLRNIYRTAKIAIDNGWLQSYHTKANFPHAMALAEKIIADSSVLGIDESNNPDSNVKDYVRGNMFQAKLPGDTVQLRKTDGSYHVIQEMVFEIFEGKNATDLLENTVSPSAPKQAESKGATVVNPTEKQAPTTAPAEQGGQKQKVESGTDGGKTGVLMPNIHLNRYMFGFNRAAVQVQKQFLNGFVAQPKKALTAQDKLVAEIDQGFDEIISEQTKMDLDRSNLEKTGQLEFDLPLELTTRQENEAIIPAVAEKLAAMHPFAETALIKKMIRQYGWIGMKLVSRGRGHFVIELNKNFHKHILKPLLQKKVPSKSIV